MITIVVIIYIGVIVLLLASMWKLFTLAGKPGWACIIPIYSAVVMLEIAKKPWWWLLLMCIPLLGIIWAIWGFNLFIKQYGKSSGYTVACIIFPYIFLPMLAFSSDTRYLGDESVNLNTLDDGMIQK